MRDRHQPSPSLPGHARRHGDGSVAFRWERPLRGGPVAAAAALFSVGAVASVVRVGTAAGDERFTGLAAVFALLGMLVFGLERARAWRDGLTIVLTPSQTTAGYRTPAPGPTFEIRQGAQRVEAGPLVPRGLLVEERPAPVSASAGRAGPDLFALVLPSGRVPPPFDRRTSYGGPRVGYDLVVTEARGGPRRVAEALAAALDVDPDALTGRRDRLG